MTRFRSAERTRLQRGLEEGSEVKDDVEGDFEVESGVEGDGGRDVVVELGDCDCVAARAPPASEVGDCISGRTGSQDGRCGNQRDEHLDLKIRQRIHCGADALKRLLRRG